MLRQQSIDKMRAMRLDAMVEEFERHLGSPELAELSFEERVGMLIDREWTEREQRKLARRLKAAKLRYPASLEDIDYKARRGLDRQVVLALSTCGWIRDHHNLIIVGPTGIGKSYLASAFAERACRSGFSSCYVRAPRLLHDLAVSRGDGSYDRVLSRLAKTDLLAIDDWLLNPMKDSERRDILEVIEDRSERSSTLLATQLPVTSWHEVIGEPNLADAICDRLIHCAHKLELKGPSMREVRAGRKATRKTKP
jgi:DNA replication protein DnaC